MKTAALFPGQGSQAVGMNRVLRDQFPWTRALFEEASDAAKMNLDKLCLDGPADELQLTHNAQPAILVTSFAWFEVLRKNLGFSPASASGHSLGEYSALLSAGAMTLMEAAALVRKRGELMQQAVPVGKGKMAAILGLDDEKVKEACELASQKDSIVVPANFNAPSQVVIAGHATAVDRVLAIFGGSLADRQDLKARKAIPLAVSAPFHCPLMKPVANAFSSSLQTVKWQQRRFPIAHNLDGKLRSEGDLVPLLRDQIDHSVLWTTCAQSLHADGAEWFVEMGPGKVLTGLVKRIVSEVKLFAMDSFDDYKAFEEAYQEAH